MPDTPALRTRMVQFRASEDADAPEGVVRGYVTTWDDPYNVGWGWNEEIARGAFTADLAQREALPIFYQHGWDAGPIGITRSITEDDHGLLLEAELFLDDSRANGIWRAMAAGALREWSIGFYPEVIEENLETKTDRVTQGRMAEASVVVRGANPSTTTVEVRSEAAECPTCKAAEEADEADAEARAAAEATEQAEWDAAVAAERDARILASPSLRALVRDGQF